MADIAFLLLIFFLVTTVIDVDTGIGMTLPPKTTEAPPKIKDRNLLEIRVNDTGAILLEDSIISLDQVRTHVTSHIANCIPEYELGCTDSAAESPQRALISFKTSSETSYVYYIDVLDEIWMAYFDLWNAEALQMGYSDYDSYKHSLTPGQINAIKDRIPAHISIADPDE